MINWSGKQVCKECGSDAIWYDAFANVNDTSDVRTFSNVFCDDCNGETTIIDADDYQPKEGN